MFFSVYFWLPLSHSITTINGLIMLLTRSMMHGLTLPNRLKEYRQNIYDHFENLTFSNKTIDDTVTAVCVKVWIWKSTAAFFSRDLIQPQNLCERNARHKYTSTFCRIIKSFIFFIPLDNYFLKTAKERGSKWNTVMIFRKPT